MLFTSWPAYALGGAGIVGLWLMQNAFSAAAMRMSHVGGVVQNWMFCTWHTVFRQDR
jgi:hypothetical protein